MDYSKRDVTKLREEIKILNDTLNKYGKKYEIDLEINEIHGINEIKSNVRIY